MAVRRALGHDAAAAAVIAAVRDLDGHAVRRLLAHTARSERVDVTVARVIVPVLRHIGQARAAGELNVMHEHFAATTIAEVLAHCQPRTPSAGRVVVMACPPGEHHDLPIELLGALLRARGWRVVSLGANTPIEAVEDAVRLLDADACVLVSVRPSQFQSQAVLLAELAARTNTPIFLAGHGATRLRSAPPGTSVLPADMRRAADLIHAQAPAQAVGQQPLT